MSSCFEVRLLTTAGDPQLIATAGALGCFEEDSSSEILEKLLALSPEERDKKCRAVLKNSFGMGHGSVGDQGYFVFSIENLPRAATLQLCLPEFASHLQQSLRRAKPERGFYLPEVIKKDRYGSVAEDILSESFRFYEEMTKAGIPGEDARYLLPLYAKTNIQTALNARELCHFDTMSKRNGVPSVVRAVIEEMMSLAKRKAPYLFENFGTNYEQLAWYPSSQLYAESNETMNRLIQAYGTRSNRAEMVDRSSVGGPITAETIHEAVCNRDEAELANLKHIHFEFLAKMSLACFHQATRQRTWNQSIEPIYAAAYEDCYKRAFSRMFIPESIKKSDFSCKYMATHQKMMGLYRKLTERNIPMQEAIGVIPHSLMVYDWIHVNGWNAIHSIGKRTCTKAQLEIREIALAMAQQIKSEMPIFDGYVEPQCVTYGKCPEKDPCGYYLKKNER